MNRQDRILTAHSQPKIKSSSRMPTRSEGNEGDMMIVNGNLLIKNRNMWLKFSSNIETADGEASSNVTIETTNVTGGVLTHGALQNVYENQHHNKVHLIGDVSNHSDVTGKSGSGNVVLSADSALTGNTDIANVNTGSVKAADGTASFTIADTTGILTVGNLIVTGDFDVGGTETINNSTTVTIDDLRFQVASDATAIADCDTAGYLIGDDGSSGGLISFLWNESSSKMILNKAFDTVANNISTTGTVTGGELQIDDININGSIIDNTNGGNADLTLTPAGTGSIVMGKVDIGGGAIDGTAIGASSASTGAFTTLSADTLVAPLNHFAQSNTSVNIDSGNIDGTIIGADNPNSIVGTTIDAEDDFTVGDTEITDGQIADTGAFNIDTGTSASHDFTIRDNKLIFTGDTNCLGIGNVDPTERLHVRGKVLIDESLDAAHSTLQFQNQYGNKLAEIGNAGPTGSSELFFKTGNEAGVLNPRMRIQPAGNVYIYEDIELGDADDTTLSRLNGGDVTIEDNVIYRAGCGSTGEGVIPVSDGGTNTSSLDAKSVLVSQDAIAPDQIQSKRMINSGGLLIGGGDGPEVSFINSDGSGSGSEAVRQGIEVINTANSIRIEIGLGSGIGSATGPCLEFALDDKIEAKVNQSDANKKLLKEADGIAIDETITPTWTALHKFEGTLWASASADTTDDIGNFAYTAGTTFPLGLVVNDKGTGGAHFIMGKDDLRVCYSAWGADKDEEDGDENYNAWD